MKHQRLDPEPAFAGRADFPVDNVQVPVGTSERRPSISSHAPMPLSLSRSRFMIADSFGLYAAKTVRDHAVSPAGRRERPVCRDAPALMAGVRVT
jgi:hypothetical protein